MGTTILVIEDEQPIRRAVRNALATEADRIIEAATAREGIDAVAAEQPALVILDLGLPDQDGISVCREIRSWSAVAIIVLSARNTDVEKVSLLDAGADDYVVKPFSSAELRARVRAHLRRVRETVGGAPRSTMTIGNLFLDLARPVVTRNGETVHLTKTEWELLRVMLRHAGRTLTHRQLFQDVWGHSHGDAQQHLRVHVRSLRRKLEDDPVRPRLIVTEPGVGYRFETSQ